MLIFDLIGIFSEKINNITDIVQILNQNTIIKSYALFSDIQKITKILKQEAQKDSIYINSNLVPNKLTHLHSSISYKRRNKMNPYLLSTLICGMVQDNKPILSTVDQLGILLSEIILSLDLDITFAIEFLHLTALMIIRN